MAQKERKSITILKASYFLPLPLWQRICVFAVYVPIVGMILPLVAVVMACVLFHDCL